MAQACHPLFSLSLFFIIFFFHFHAMCFSSISLHSPFITAVVISYPQRAMASVTQPCMCELTQVLATNIENPTPQSASAPPVLPIKMARADCRRRRRSASDTDFDMKLSCIDKTKRQV